MVVVVDHKMRNKSNFVSVDKPSSVPLAEVAFLKEPIFNPGGGGLPYETDEDARRKF